LKLRTVQAFHTCSRTFSSIHPQGWVPIETCLACAKSWGCVASSIHPQGWVPIETIAGIFQLELDVG